MFGGLNEWGIITGQGVHQAANAARNPAINHNNVKISMTRSLALKKALGDPKKARIKQTHTKSIRGFLYHV
jgi:hypothetical protein